MIERIILAFFCQTLNQNLKTADKAHLIEPFICVCAPWRTKCQETFGKISNFKSFTWTEWDLWLILNSPGTHLLSQSFAIHNMLCHSLVYFLRKFVFFVCVQYAAESPWMVCGFSLGLVFSNSCELCCIGDRPSNVLLWDLSSVNTAAGNDLWHLRDFYLCRLWCLLDSVELQRLLKLFKEPLVGGEHLETIPLGAKSIDVAH